MTGNQDHTIAYDVPFIGVESGERLSQYDGIRSNSGAWPLVEATVASSSALQHPRAPTTTCRPRFDLDLLDSGLTTPEVCEEAQTITPSSMLELGLRDVDYAPFFPDCSISPYDTFLSAANYPSSFANEHQEGTAAQSPTFDLFAELQW